MSPTRTPVRLVATPRGKPWSAAFVSYVIQTALGKAQFPGIAAHTAYSQAIRTNPTRYAFTALDPNVSANYPLQVGDIIVVNRQDENGVWNNQRFSQSTPWEGVSHGDIVVSVQGNSIQIVGGNLNQTVEKKSVTISSKLSDGYFTILRPKTGTNVAEIVRVAIQEHTLWTSRGWKETTPAAFNTLKKYWNNIGWELVADENIAAAGTVAAAATRPPAPPINGISPYIASIESFHPFIQYELTRRRDSAETANVYMPYAKLTSLVNVLPKNLRGETKAHCPSLGIHGKPNVEFDDIFNPQDGRSIVGYATNDNGQSVPVVVETSDQDQINIPTPGIVSINAERGTAGPMGVRGGLFRGTINIRAYSLGQVNALLLYFLRPATRVILELGRESSSPFEQQLTNSTELGTFRKEGFGGGDINRDGRVNEQDSYVRELFQKFNWERKIDEINKELEPLVRLTKGQEEFVQRYVYNNFGNYEIYIGYVVSFKLKYTKDNIYEIELLVHSIQQFEVPTKQSGTQPLTKVSVPNSCDAIEIMDYFDPTSGWRANSFKQLLVEASTEGKSLYEQGWGSHVRALRGAGADAGSGNSKSPGYLVSWRFFVDVILNDTSKGMLSIFQLNDNSETMKVLKSAVIRPTGTATTNPSLKILSGEVAYHPALRSTDINTMIIYNPAAQGDSAADAAYNTAIGVIRESATLSTEELEKLETGVRDQSLREFITNNQIVGAFSPTNEGTAFLSNGVWLNTNAIIDAFSGADTITAALNRLLTMMNNATQGFWNLQLMSAESAELPGVYPIDMGLSKPVKINPRPSTEDIFVSSAPSSPDSIQGLVDRFKQDVDSFVNSETGGPKYLYLFNRKLVKSNDRIVGSELLDINIDSNLPQVIAVQAIAGVGGIAQRGSLEAIDIKELQSISLYDVYPKDTDQVIDSVCEQEPRSRASFLEGKEFRALTQEEINKIFTNVNVLVRNNYGEWREQWSQEIKDIETSALERWKTENRAAIDAGTLKESAGQQLITDEIQSIRSTLLEIAERDTPGLLNLVREYSGVFGRAIDLIETNISRLIKILDVTNEESGNPNKVHPFNASNLTKTTVELKMPGIGGIQLFQSFAVDRAPNILERGYYVVTKVKHEFTVENGWTTSVEGRFRYKPDPTSPRQ